MKQEHLNKAIQLRHELHAHPELSGQEVWTKQHLMSFLKEHTSNLTIVDKGRYFYAKYMGGTDCESIAFRADFDALPIPETIELPWQSRNAGVSHKCGHDGHAAVLAGFALEVDLYGADRNIFFIFQHAEETGQGAIEAVEVVKEENIKEIYAFHNMSGLPHRTIHVVDGTAHCASKGMSIRMIGSPAHASQPEDGVNPAPAIASIIDTLPKMTSIERYEGFILCTIIQVDVGSNNFGIAAYEGVLRLTIRAEKEADLETLQHEIEHLAITLGAEQRLKVQFDYTDEFPETVNHEQQVEKVRRFCRDKGLPLAELPAPYRASEDFGHFLKQAKGAIFYIGNGEDYPQIHTYEYDFRDDLIETAVEVFKGLAGVRDAVNGTA